MVSNLQQTSELLILKMRPWASKTQRRTLFLHPLLWVKPHFKPLKKGWWSLIMTIPTQSCKAHSICSKGNSPRLLGCGEVKYRSPQERYPMTTATLRLCCLRSLSTRNPWMRWTRMTHRSWTGIWVWSCPKWKQSMTVTNHRNRTCTSTCNSKWNLQKQNRNLKN